MYRNVSFERNVIISLYTVQHFFIIFHAFNIVSAQICSCKKRFHYFHIISLVLCKMQFFLANFFLFHFSFIYILTAVVKQFAFKISFNSILYTRVIVRH